MHCFRTLALAPVLLTAGVAVAQEEASASRPDESSVLTSVGPIAFAPETLLISDPKAARVYAVEIGDLADGLASDTVIEEVDAVLAAALGTTPRELRIVDLAVHQGSKQVFVAAMRGRGPDAIAVVAHIGKGGEIDVFELAERKTASVALPNPPKPGTGRRANQQMESITDIAHVGGKVVVAGLSNEEFASKLRVLDFPFAEADAGASVEIYHGAHGRLETRSPVRTFVSYEIGGDPHLLAAYTCTPLVKIRLGDLEPGAKITGQTIAELGNRNRPLDMIVYDKDGSKHLLIANSSRGVMKVSTEGIGSAAAIAAKVERGGTEGLPYDTIEDLKGVEQLDKFGDAHAVVLIKTDDGTYDLRVIPLP